MRYFTPPSDVCWSNVPKSILFPLHVPRYNTNTHPAPESLSWLWTILYQVSIIVWTANKAGWHLIRSPVIILARCLSGTAGSIVTPLGGEEGEDAGDTGHHSWGQSGVTTSWDHVSPHPFLPLRPNNIYIWQSAVSPVKRAAAGELSVEFLVYFLKTPLTSNICRSALLGLLLYCDELETTSWWLVIAFLRCAPDYQDPPSPVSPLVTLPLSQYLTLLLSSSPSLPGDQTVTSSRLTTASSVQSLDSKIRTPASQGLLCCDFFCSITSLLSGIPGVSTGILWQFLVFSLKLLTPKKVPFFLW